MASCSTKHRRHPASWGTHRLQDRSKAGCKSSHSPAEHGDVGDCSRRPTSAKRHTVAQLSPARARWRRHNCARFPMHTTAFDELRRFGGEQPLRAPRNYLYGRTRQDWRRKENRRCCPAFCSSEIYKHDDAAETKDQLRHAGISCLHSWL